MSQRKRNNVKNHNVKNTCNLIGQNEYNIGRIVLSASILYYLTKGTRTFECRGRKKVINLK